MLPGASRSLSNTNNVLCSVTNKTSSPKKPPENYEGHNKKHITLFVGGQSLQTPTKSKSPNIQHACFGFHCLHSKSFSEATDKKGRRIPLPNVFYGGFQKAQFLSGSHI